MDRNQYESKFNNIAKCNVYKEMFGSSFTEFFKLPFSESIQRTLDKALFFSNRKEVSIENKDANLTIRVETNKHKQVYLSYLNLDNDFDKIPEKALIERKNGEHFIRIELESNEINIRPFLVFYDDSSKTRLFEVTKRIEKISFRDNEQSCRLTFKLEGFGVGHIKNLELYYFELGDTTD